MSIYEVGPHIEVEADGPVRVVRLDRPEHLNATNHELHAGLAALFPQIDHDDGARAVVLTGNGRAFSAGGDFTYLDELARDADLRRQTLVHGKQIVTGMVSCRVPVIAAVNGPAVGLGCSLALSCDIVLMSDRAHLADPHVGVGLVAGDGGAALWPLFTSLLRVKEYLFTGDAIPPELAVQIGLANRVIPHADLMDEALRLAHRLARAPQTALRDTKRALQAHVERAVAGPLEIAIQAEIKSMASREHGERVKKLIERSKRS